MAHPNETYQPTRHIVSSWIMILALTWLTVSLPFVNAVLMQADVVTEQSSNSVDEESGNAFSNTTEEKTPNGAGSFSEYLHEPFSMSHAWQTLVKGKKCHSSKLYFAYHPELISPPPEASLPS